MHKAVGSGNVKLVEMLLDNGADPNIIKNIEGETNNYTSLNLACETFNIPIIKLLLKHGAIPNDNDDETNFMWIIENDEETS
ncbi:ankyrin repeat domain-containing protein, partial [bacterium]|nr:ankyrin repeat domain-containing protein [bacterium]